MITNETHQIFDNCLNKLKEQDYIGYDPADLMNTSYRFIKNLPEPVIRLLTIINFLSPINFRGILKIQPTKNTTATVVLAIALLNVYKKTGKIEYLSEAQKLEKWLINHAVLIDETIGWSRVIQYQSRGHFQHANGCTLTLINAYALELYLDLYQITSKENYLNIAKKIRDHLINHTNRITYDYGCCLSYINDAREEVLNASILAGAALNRYSQVVNDEEAFELSIKILNYILYRQNKNGSWEYSYKNNVKPKRQYDFHQCYILDGIMKYYLENDLQKKEKVKTAFAKGMDFYFNYQLDKKMRPFWRYPIKYPIDIHNVSHAIFFVSKYYSLIPDPSIKLDKLMFILINDYYDDKKFYFYYQKYPLLTIRHNFFRWNTAWTLYALSHLISNNQIKKDFTRIN